MQKFLQRMLLLVAVICMPRVMQAQISCADGVSACSITISGQDSYGDGWNGASISIYQGSTLRGTFTVASSSDSQTFDVCADSIRFVWTMGSYDSECSFQIAVSGGATMYTCTDGSALSSTFYEGLVVCPSCIAPSGLAVSGLGLDEFTLSWNANGSSAWVVEYSNAPFTAMSGDGTTVNVTDATLTVYGLDSATNYYGYVYTDCGTEYSQPVPFSLRTLEALPATLPYVCDFEADGNNGWALVNGTQTNYWTVGSATNNGGSQALYVTNDGTSNSYSNSNTSYTYATRDFDLTEAGEYAVSFDWKGQGESQYYDFLRVFLAPASETFTAGSVMGGSTNSFASVVLPNNYIDLSGITSAPFTLALSSSWNTVQSVFHVNNPGVYKLVFAWANDDSGGTNPPSAVDNVMFVQNTCPQPQNLVLADATTESITLTWTPGGQETQWVVALGEDEYTVNDTTITFQNLEASTMYAVTLRALCGSDDTSLVVNGNFRTACGEITELPWSENFEAVAGGDRPGCWECGGLGSNPYTSVYGGSNTLDMYNYHSSSTTNPATYASLPPLDTLTNPLSNIQVSFNAMATSSSTGSNYPRTIAVGVCEVAGDLTTFTGVDTITAIPTVMTNYLVNFDNYEGYGQFITFVSDGHFATGSYGYNYVAIDDIIVRNIPDCPQPSDLTLVSAGQVDNVVVTWTEEGDASQWELAYGLAGFDPDTLSEYLSVYEDTASITDMMGGLTYDVYVRAICSEESYWAGPLQVTPGSFNMPATGSYTTNMCSGVIYDDGGANGNYSAYCNSTLTVYPSSPDSVISFYGTYTGETCCDYFYVYDGANSNGTALVNGIQGSNNSFGPFTSVSGPITIVFTSDVSGQYAGFEVHVSCLARPECRDIASVSVDGVSTSSAIVSWTIQNSSADMPSGFVVTVTDTNDNATIINTTEQMAVITGLDAGTPYTVSVQGDCNGTLTNGESADFQTSSFACLQMDPNTVMVDTVGNGTVTNTNIPSYSFYGHGLTQQIYLASELDGLQSGAITHIGFQLGAMAQDRAWDIYLTNTTASNVSSAFIPVSENDLVWSGQSSTFTANSWNDLVLTNGFSYTGGNILVTFRDHTGSYVSGNQSVGHSSTSGISRYIYQDASAYSATNPPSGGTASDYRMNMAFFGGTCAQLATCADPIAIITNLSSDQVDVTWAPGASETAWNVEHKAAGDASWTVDATNVSTTSYSFTNLSPATSYQFRVSVVCTDTHAVVLNATTPCVALPIPFYEDFSTWETSMAYIHPCWTKGTNYSSTYPYVSGTSYASDSRAAYMYSTNNTYSYYALPALDAPLDTLELTFALYRTNTSYNHDIQVGVMTDPDDISTFQLVGTATPTQLSTWEYFEFTFPGHTNGFIALVSPSNAYSYPYLDNIAVVYKSNCARPTNLTASNATTNTVNVAWSDTTATNFEIEYGPTGFQHGDGTTVLASGNTAQLTGLMHSSVYDFYVRAFCSASDTSNWSFVGHFTTACGMIDQLPYTQNFEGWGTGSSVHAPNCWAYGSDYTSTYPYISTTNHTPGGNGAMYMYNYTGSTASGLTYVSMPAVDSTVASVNQLQVVFWTTTTTSSYEHLVIVGVCDQPGVMSTFVPIDTVVAHYNVWEEHEIAFDQYTGTGKYITFAAAPGAGYTTCYPYIDDIILEMIPTCQRPNDLTASNATSNSVDLAWNDRAGASNWFIEYGPEGFELGTGTVVMANSNPYTLTGLPASYQGEFYVRAFCGGNDTGDYSRHSCLFATSQVPATVPYTYDFENDAEWANWQQTTNPSSNVHWARGNAGSSDLGTGSYGMYCTNDDSTATYVANVTNATIYRDIDFGSVDTSFVIGFDAFMGGSTTANYDGLMVFLADPSQAVVSTDANITTPWGSVNDLYRIASVRVNSLDNGGWTRVEGTFDNLSGIHRVAFFWFHQGATTNFVGEMAQVDNISIQYASCPRPFDVEITPAATTAHVTWGGPAVAQYEVIYRQYPGGTNTTVNVNTNNVVLTGLDPLTQYAVWVRKVCGEETSLESDGQLFNTNLCDGGVIVENWDSTSTMTTTSYFPGYSTYNYTYSQVIIDSADIANAGITDSIIALGYNPTVTTAGDYFTNCDVYLANVSATDLSTGFIMYDTTWTQVNVNTDLGYDETGWHIVGFDNNFLWDGHSNVLVSVNRKHGSWTSGSTFEAHIATSIKGRYVYNDNNQYDPSTVSGGTATSTVANYRLYSCGINCAKPTLTNVTDVNYEQATINWASNATDFEVAIMNNGTWSAETAVSNDYNYTFTNLQPQTTYQYRVRAICDAAEGLISDWSLGSFTTEELPCFAPTAVQATPGFTSAAIDWTPGTSETHWSVRVYNTAFDSTYAVTAHPFTVAGLNTNTTYNVTVLALCGTNGTVPSDNWSDTISFTTDQCDAPTNLTATVNQNSAVLTWTPGANNTGNWIVEYGPQGFTSGTGTTVNATTNTVTISNLEWDQDYDAYVRANCEAGALSTWSNKASFTTPRQQVGIENVNAADMSIYPNPASGNTSISLSGVSGDVRLMIVDMNGRTVRTEQMTCDGTCVKVMDVEGLASGAYFVRVMSDNFNTVKKLIVK